MLRKVGRWEEMVGKVGKVGGIVGGELVGEGIVGDGMVGDGLVGQ